MSRIPDRSVEVAEGRRHSLCAHAGRRRFWDAPDAAKASQALVGIVVKFPIADGVSVPVSLRWSNRDQLLQDSDEIVGNIGITFDLDELMK